jgi:transcriptional regulator with XRE-family HTH domain
MRPLTLRHFIAWLIESLEHAPMAQLRKMRDLERRVRSLVAGRNTQILAAIELGYSQRQIAVAAGISQGRVNQIKNGES